MSILTFLGMVIVNKVPHYRVTKLEPHTTDTQVRSGQLQFCHPNSEAPIIARKAIPKLTEMDKLPVLNTSAPPALTDPGLPRVKVFTDTALSPTKILLQISNQQICHLRYQDVYLPLNILYPQ